MIVVGTHADEVQRGTAKQIIKVMREKYVFYEIGCLALLLIRSCRYLSRFPNIVDIFPISLATGKGTQEYAIISASFLGYWVLIWCMQAANFD